MKVFVGTPEEFEKIAHLFEDGASAPPKSTKPEAMASEPSSGPDTAIAERAFARLPMSPNQKAVLAALLATPNYIYATDLARKVGVRRPQLAGIWGAIGRRLNNTRGIPDEPWKGLVDEEWDQDKSEWKYRAGATLREVARRGAVSFT